MNSLAYINNYINENILESTSNFLEDYFKDNLIINSNNYFSEFYIIRNKLKYFNFNTISTYKPIRNIDNNSFYLENSLIEINNLKELFNNILLEIEEFLYINLLFFNNSSSKDYIPNIDFKKIEDSKTTNKNLEDISNTRYLSNFRDIYIKRFYNKESFIYKYFNRNNKLINNIKLFLNKVSKFSELLLLGFYLLSTSPLRGEELVIITYKNSTINGLKNIYFDIDTRLIAINTSYSKSRDLTNINKSNIRFLPYRLTRVTIYYITLLKPFIDYLNFNYLDNKTINTKLFITLYNISLNSNILSKLLINKTKEYFKVKIDIRLYRYFITFIIKDKILKNNTNLLTPTKLNKNIYINKNTSNIDDILANRSTTIANLNYARDTNFFSNKTRDITLRSIEYSKKYFEYFKINTFITIEDLLEDYNNRELEEKSNSSNFNSNSSNSLSIDLEANSIDTNIKSSNILDTKFFNSSSSSSSSSSNSKSKSKSSSKSFNSNSTFNNFFKFLDESPTKLNKNNLKKLEKSSTNPKSKNIINYLDTITISSNSSSSSNISSNSNINNPNNIDLGLNNLKVLSSNSNFNIKSNFRDSNSNRFNTNKSKSNSNSNSKSNSNIDLDPTSNIDLSSSPPNINLESTSFNISLNPTSNLDLEVTSNIESSNPVSKKRGRPKKIRTNKRGRPRKG